MFEVFFLGRAMLVASADSAGDRGLGFDGSKRMLFEQKVTLAREMSTAHGR